MATKKITSRFGEFKTWREAEYKADSKVGNRMKPIYSSRYDDNGRIVVEKIGEDDLYDRIQSFKDECDINVIIKRYQMGDVAALNKAQGIYVDATAAPDNIADLLNKLNKAEYDFDRLPAEVKQRYGNDFVNFIMNYDPMELVQKVNEQTLIKEEVKDESE